ncbi:MAG: hypothetical protein AAB229_08630 [Candidatus Hydrogenedentota bacterium]
MTRFAESRPGDLNQPGAYADFVAPAMDALMRRDGISAEEAEFLVLRALQLVIVRSSAELVSVVDDMRAPECAVRSSVDEVRACAPA